MELNLALLLGSLDISLDNITKYEERTLIDNGVYKIVLTSYNNSYYTEIICGDSSFSFCVEEEDMFTKMIGLFNILKKSYLKNGKIDISDVRYLDFSDYCYDTPFYSSINPYTQYLIKDGELLDITFASYYSYLIRGNLK